jgi:hypothetical protein
MWPYPRGVSRGCAIHNFEGIILKVYRNARAYYDLKTGWMRRLMLKNRLSKSLMASSCEIS